MDLAGQGATARELAIRRNTGGYAMAALLVALAVMSVLLAVALPVWKQASQREKEAELIFRGEQYARAIGLFQRRAGPGALPPNLDVLVQQRFLRRKYKDPVTNDEFQPLLGGQQTPGTPAGPGVVQPGAPGGGSPGGRGAPPATPGATPGAPGGTAIGGIQGVVSKSKAKSIRLYNGRGAYNEWSFVFVPQQQAGTPGGAPGGRGGPGAGGPGAGGPATGLPGPGGRGGAGAGGGRGTGRGFPSPSGPFGPSRESGGTGGAPAPGPFGRGQTNR